MKKNEIIWRELLFQSVERRQSRFVQQELAEKFGFSTSTVHQALKVLRQMGAVKVGGRGFRVVDPEKILFHWANDRRLTAEIKQATFVDLPILEIEGQLPNGTMPTAYTAVRERFGEAPADYSKVYVYHQDINSMKERFPVNSKTSNLLVLQADPWLDEYGDQVTLAQLFVDLWNLTDWYAKPFVERVKEEINELLS